MKALYLPAPAKLNLVLRVVGRRADGYHLLETLFHTISLHDDLWMMRVDDGSAIELQMTADEDRFRVSTGPDNLIVRAVEAVRRAAGVPAGFRVRLHKRIPVGGGLGGGSSDAAAAIRLCNALLGEPLGAAELHQVASGLGADVAFLLTGGSQWGRGIGDELSPAQVEPLHFVLVVPPFDCPTAEVYKNRAPSWHDGGPQDSTGGAPDPTTRDCPPDGGRPTRDSTLRIGFRNDLRQAAEAVRPALSTLRQRVADLGGSSVHLTGSGSTLFVACAERAAAERCAAKLQPLQSEGVAVLLAGSVAASESPRWTVWPGAGPPKPPATKSGPGLV